MSFTKQEILDRIIEHPGRYQLTEVSTGIYDLTPVTGTVTEAGTAVNRTLLQRYEDELEQLNRPNRSTFQKFMTGTFGR
jgi:hypothetical protein